MENYYEPQTSQESPVEQTDSAISNYPIQRQQPYIQQYAMPQQHMQHYVMHQMPMAPMPMYPSQHLQMPIPPVVQPMMAPPVVQQMSQMPLAPIQQLHAQQLPPLSSFAAISPVAPDSFKRKNESPVKKINFPAAKIKAIMKADDEVAMISSDAVLAMSAATELFLQELADAAWKHTSRDSRKTILYKDVANAVESSIEFEFLNDVNETY
jgi:DNA polymerase epsilon subunit 4